MKITPIFPEHLEDLIDFLAKVNARPEQHIAFLGETQEDIRHSLMSFEPPVEQAFRLAQDENGQVLAAFGTEYDTVLKRTWLFGPFSAQTNLEAISDALYSELERNLPEEIELQELFCDLRNQECQKFAARHGFELYKDTAILSLARQQWHGVDRPTRTDRAEIQPLSPQHFPAFAALHELCFPNTYYNPQQMCDLRDDVHHLLLAVRNDEVPGYIFFKGEPDINEGYIEFLGVAPEWRGKGIGRGLLQAALETIFAHPAIPRTHLTVNADNLAARKMYDSFGFTCERVARSFRKSKT